MKKKMKQTNNAVPAAAGTAAALLMAVVATVLYVVAVPDLPHILAILNGSTVVLLIGGYVNIRRGRRQAHKAFMLGAVGVAAAFLVIYLYYHANAGLARFGGTGMVRPIYFTILIAHVLGAAVIAVMVPWTLVRALRGRFEAHKKMARWTLPLWLYVSISGLVVYVMAVHIYPYTGS